MLEDLGRLGVDELLCLGDIVGYGADPGPVVDVIAARAVVAVAGNHDQAATGLIGLASFNPYARRAAEWTAEQLVTAQSGYLAALPLITEHAGATLVHASPRDPGRWPYVISAADGLAAFRAFPTFLCFIGHSHLPMVWALGEDRRVVHRRGAGRLPLARHERYLVNVGSVGQPRDGDPLAAYAVWDAEAGWVEIRRVPYALSEARGRIHKAGLPRILGDRLLDGR